MAKLKITQKQYDAILLHEKETRLKSLIKEEKASDVMPRDMADICLIVSKLLGNNLSGLNKVNAEQAIANKNYLKRLKEMLENADKTKELIEALEEKGLSNPTETLGRNAKKIIEEDRKRTRLNSSH